MSKAFTRESDDLPERPSAPRPASALPAGVRNYLTPGGAKRLQAELDALLHSNATSPRVATLRQALQTIEIVPPPPPPYDSVRFGATVIVRDSSGQEESYRIVGADETDIERDWISWVSPLARALLNARAGDRVKIKLPGGERLLEITAITYDSL